MGVTGASAHDLDRSRGETGDSSRIDEEQPNPRTVVLSIFGDADLSRRRQLRDRLGEVIDESRPRWSLDLSGATFLDSMTLGVFLQRHEAPARAGRTLPHRRSARGHQPHLRDDAPRSSLRPGSLAAGRPVRGRCGRRARGTSAAASSTDECTGNIVSTAAISSTRRIPGSRATSDTVRPAPPRFSRALTRTRTAEESTNVHPLRSMTRRPPARPARAPPRAPRSSPCRAPPRRARRSRPPVASRSSLRRRPPLPRLRV